MALVEYRNRRPTTRQSAREEQIVPPIDIMLDAYLKVWDVDADEESDEVEILDGKQKLMSDLVDASWTCGEADDEYKRIWISNLSDDRFGFDDTEPRSAKVDDRVRASEDA